MPAATIGESASGVRNFEMADVAVLGAVVFAACGHLMIKAGLNGVLASAGEGVLVRLALYLLQPLVLIGLLTYVAGTAMWVFAVSKRDISYVFPITALNYVLVTVGGKLLFHEVVAFKRWLGIAVVIVGVGLMQVTGRKDS